MNSQSLIIVNTLLYTQKQSYFKITKYDRKKKIKKN